MKKPRSLAQTEARHPVVDAPQTSASATDVNQMRRQYIYGINAESRTS